MQSGTDTHRRKVSEKKHAAIVDAARKNFLTHGYAGAGMAEIARDADVSTATLYKHFASKEALFAAVVQQVARNAGDYSGLSAPNDTARDVLYKVCRTYLAAQFEQDANALMRIVMAEVPGAPQLARETYAELGLRRTDSFAAVVDDMIARGMLRPHDSAFSARVGSGILKEIFVWPALFDKELGLPADMDEKIHRCIDCFLAIFGPED